MTMKLAASRPVGLDSGFLLIQRAAAPSPCLLLLHDNALHCPISCGRMLACCLFLYGHRQYSRYAGSSHGFFAVSGEATPWLAG